jgi:hypothetical protein
MIESFSWGVRGGDLAVETSVRGSVHVLIDRLGAAQAHGVVVVRSADDVFVFRAIPGEASATCADANGDGVGGMTSVQVGLEHGASGERLVALFEPAAGEIDREGWHDVVIRIGDATFDGRAHVTLPGRGREPRD